MSREALVNIFLKDESSRTVVCQSVFTCFLVLHDICFLVFYDMLKQISKKDVIILMLSYVIANMQSFLFVLFIFSLGRSFHIIQKDVQRLHFLLDRILFQYLF